MQKPTPLVLNAGAALCGVAAGVAFGVGGIVPLALGAGAVLAAGGLVVFARKTPNAEPSARAAGSGAMAELIRMASGASGEGLLIATWDGVGMYANDAFRRLFFLDATGGADGARELLDEMIRTLDGQGRSREVFARLRAAAEEGERV